MTMVRYPSIPLFAVSLETDLSLWPWVIDAPRRKSWEDLPDDDDDDDVDESEITEEER
ncbi:hypothetical protein QZH41_018378, partial [Actinostola sp. cb2023]